MRFINTEGLSFLGPGSEWFWTAVSAIALLVTLLAIYRQLLIQKALKEAQQFEDLDQQWESERYLRSRRAMAVTLRDGGDLSGLSSTNRIGDFWDHVGSLVRAGHVGKRQITAQWHGIILVYWTMLEPVVVARRIEYGVADEWENFEWLAKQMLKVVGDTNPRALAPLDAERIDNWLTQLDESIALEESLRAVPHLPAAGAA